MVRHHLAKRLPLPWSLIDPDFHGQQIEEFLRESRGRRVLNDLWNRDIDRPAYSSSTILSFVRKLSLLVSILSWQALFRRICFLALLAGLLTGCGSSSTTNVTAPSDARCAIAVSGPMPVIESAGGTGRLNIRINRECTWSARSEVDWIAISPASGQGEAQIDYSVAANPLAAPRTGVIVVNDQRTELRQAAACLYTLTPRQQTAQSSGERLTVTVSTAAGCAWTAVSQSSWISVESGANGSGNGTVSLLVTPNTGASRTGTVSIAGQPHTVSQAAAEGTPAPPTPTPTPDADADADDTDSHAHAYADPYPARVHLRAVEYVRVGRRVGRNNLSECEDASPLRVDGCRQCRVALSRRGSVGHRQRHRAILRRAEHGDVTSYRHVDDCGPGLHGDTGWNAAAVHVHRRADECECPRGRGLAFGDRHGVGCLVPLGSPGERTVDRGDVSVQRIGQRPGELLGGVECRERATVRDADDRRSNRDSRSGGWSGDDDGHRRGVRPSG